jgi:hypothetical protein
MVSQSVGGAKQDGIGFPNRRNKNYESQASTNQVKIQEKEQYYKFYLDSAQKAIDMMRK